MSKHSQAGDFSCLEDLVPTLPQNTLVIRDIDRCRAQGRSLPNIDRLQFIDLQSLDDNFLNDHAPDIVLSPLLACEFDAIDVAKQLADLAFAGRYRAITDPVPDAEMIRDEVRTIAPDINFDVVIMPGTSAQA